MGTQRISLGRYTNEEEMEQEAKVIIEEIGRLHKDKVFTIPVERAEKVRLTRYTRGLGCACKLPAEQLNRLLAKPPEVWMPVC